MASSSSLSFTDEWKYDVFLSFRGIDTRSGFTGSLHRALCGKEIKSFMDDQNLEKGAEINPALDEAIQSSRIAVVVLSKNYASSTFCLDELGKIMDCSKDKGMLVLPVFYEVEPSDVRYQKGKYADALNKHEARITEKEKLEKWRVALTKISHISGWPFTRDRGYEYDLIDKIVEDIIKKFQSLRDEENKARQRLAAAVKIQRAFRNFNEAPWRSAAMKIQHAFRNFNEARQRVAAMKIQHAFHNFKRRKMMAAIQDPSDEGDDGRTFPHQENAQISRTSPRPEELGLFLEGEEDEEGEEGEEDDETVLWHRITSDDIYRKEEDKIISWREPEIAAELRLSFDEPSGCSYIWDHICSVQSNMQSNTLNRVKSVEINSKPQKVTVTGYVEPNNVPEEAEIRPSVPYHCFTEIYAVGTGARSFDDYYVNMFSDENTDSCSIM